MSFVARGRTVSTVAPVLVGCLVVPVVRPLDAATVGSPRLTYLIQPLAAIQPSGCYGMTEGYCDAE